MSLKEAALSYARMGYAVFPLRERDKRPKIKGWPRNWSKDEDQIKDWWNKWPQANIGIVCGEPSNLVVLDVDGREGHRALRGQEIPPTVTATTGRDQGSHFWFRYDPDDLDVDITKKQSIYTKVDLQAGGSYVVAPPSVHPSGETYQFIPSFDPDTRDPLAVPRWIQDIFRDTGDGNVTGTILEDDYAPGDGQLISPLFKKSSERKYGGLAPLEAPDSDSGQRNRWLYEKALTHFNLGLSYQSFRAIFYNRVLPRMDRSEGADGEPFTNEEINRTIKSAREDAKKCGPLPSNIIRYHTYRKSDKPPEEKEYERGPTRWSRYGLKHAVLAFMCRHREREYRSGEDGQPCLQQLISELNDYVRDSWHHKADVPRTSLCRVLTDLEEAGQITRESDRLGTGHAVLRLGLTSKKPASVPTPRSNNSEKSSGIGGSLKQSGKKANSARRNVSEPSRHPDRDPPKPMEVPLSERKKYLECSLMDVPDYENVELLIANAGMTLRPGERKTCHLIAWVTDDKDFATWVSREYSAEVIGIVLRDLRKHYDEIKNIGGWMRSRLAKVASTFDE